VFNNPPVAISKEYNYALDRMEHSMDSLFITGRAGTGKSTLLGIFRDTTKKRCVFLAPTGVAALHIRGQTIHSFFMFPPKMLGPNDITKRKNHRLYKKVDCIVIDEISMVRVDMIDAIDNFLQKNRENSEPFGGVQMIFFGDLFQLPPVVSNPFERKHLQNLYDSQYFFSAMVMNRLKENIEMIELHQVYRQNDPHFIKILDSIRTRTFDEEDLIDLNQRVMKEDELLDHDFITLATRNDIVNRINSGKLEELSTSAYLYNSKVKGKFNVRTPPAPLTLILKVGAQVMFVRNDPEKKYVNGTLGIIQELQSNTIKVQIKDSGPHEGEIIDVDKSIWEIIKYKYSESNPKQISTDVIGTFEQYPLKLAWAVTIHKSQGKTFQNVLIDLGGGSFDFGQTYVALSRCNSLEGIIMKKPIRPQDILVDELIVDYYSSWR